MTFPTGTVTFLFTDIESSSQLWQQHPESMQGALARHDKLIKEAIESNGGHIVKMRGDGAHAVFASAVDGASAAIAGQRAIANEPWPQPLGALKVRMGMHSGHAQLRDGDYFGSVVNQAARIQDTAHGGQTLLSRATQAVIQGNQPRGAELTDLGTHYIRDFPSPVRIYQLSAADLNSTFPALRGLLGKKSNLPSQHTPFVGRKVELERLAHLLTSPNTRLLTIVAPGGMGKSRLSLALGEHCLKSQHFPDGIYFVPLAPLQEADDMPTTIAAALGFPFGAGGNQNHPPKKQLLDYLQSKHLLLILDNFEHLLEGAMLVNDILQAAPGIRIIATSRERLQLRSEHAYPIAGLEIPKGAEFTDFLDCAAVQMFIQSAQRVAPGFTLEPNDLDDLSNICHLVAGMPLALELAAGWVDMLPLKEIATEIQQSLDFLETELRDVPDRQRSIRAVFETSWARMNDAERESYPRLSVFRGGFSRHAARTVSGASLRTLSALVNKSLLVFDRNQDRYQIHELLRQYASEQLDNIVGASEQSKADHALFFIDFLAQRRPDVAGGRQLKALQEIKSEFENVRVAWLWSAVQADTNALEIASQAFGAYFMYGGAYMEGQALLSKAVEALQALPIGKVRDQALIVNLVWLGWLHMRFGELEEIELAMNQCHAIYDRLRILPLPGITYDPKIQLGFVSLIRGDYANAIELSEQVRQTAELQKNEHNLQFAYHELAEANLGLGEYQTAQKFAEMAHAQTLITADRWFRAYVLNTLGQIGAALGDPETAEDNFRASYEIREAFDDPEGMALALLNLGDTALAKQSVAEAEERFQRSHVLFEQINDKGGLAAANKRLGVVFCQQEKHELAQKHFRQALQLALDIDYRSLLFALIVDIATWLWGIGQQEWSIYLLAFAAHHPNVDYETQKGASARLTNEYRSQVSPGIFAAAEAKGVASDFDGLLTDLVNQLTRPLTNTKST